MFISTVSVISMFSHIKLTERYFFSAAPTKELSKAFVSQFGQYSFTPRLNIFRIRTDRAQGNQVHGFIVQSLEVLNIDFQPIPTTSKFYSIAT